MSDTPPPWWDMRPCRELIRPMPPRERRVRCGRPKDHNGDHIRQDRRARLIARQAPDDG